MIKVVFAFPPRLSLRTKVSLLSRYGMWVDFLAEDKAWMQFPSAERDWLIFLASSSVFPVAPVLLTFSLPARSARFSLPSFVLPSGIFWISEMINSE